MELIERIRKSAVFVLFPLALLSALIEWKRLPLSIILGGALGLLNIEGLAWGVRELLNADRPGAKVMFLSQFRFVMLLTVIAALAFLRVVNLVGLLAGFTVVFVLVVVEGLRYAKKETEKEGK